MSPPVSPVSGYQDLTIMKAKFLFLVFFFIFLFFLFSCFVLFQRKFLEPATLKLFLSLNLVNGDAGCGMETMTNVSLSIIVYLSFATFLTFRFVAVSNLTMCWWWNGRNKLGHEKLNLHAGCILHCLERLGW